MSKSARPPSPGAAINIFRPVNNINQVMLDRLRQRAAGAGLSGMKIFEARHLQAKILTATRFRKALGLAGITLTTGEAGDLADEIDDRLPSVSNEEIGPLHLFPAMLVQGSGEERSHLRLAIYNPIAKFERQWVLRIVERRYGIPADSELWTPADVGISIARARSTDNLLKLAGLIIAEPDLLNPFSLDTPVVEDLGPLPIAGQP